MRFSVRFIFTIITLNIKVPTRFFLFLKKSDPIISDLLWWRSVIFHSLLSRQVLIVVFLIGVTMMETAPTPQNKRAKVKNLFVFFLCYHSWSLYIFMTYSGKWFVWFWSIVRLLLWIIHTLQWKPKAIRDKEAAEAKAAEESAAKAAEEAAKGAATTIKTVEEEVKTVENKVQVDQVIAKVEDHKATSHDATKVCYPAPEKESDTKIAVVSTDEQVKTTENIAADVQVTAGAIIVAEEPAAVAAAEEPAVVVVADKTAAVVADEPVAVVVVEEPVAAVVAAEEPAVVVKDEPVAAVVVVDEEPIVVKAEESAAVL